MRVLADSSLPNVDKYSAYPFTLTLYASTEELLANISKSDILVCRSTLKVSIDILKNTAIKCVATASSGTDHIDKDYLQENNIQLIDAKGSNAHSVVDYVTACLAYLSTANKLSGTRVGIVGVGCVGSQLYSRLKFLGFTVYCYDPWLDDSQEDFKFCDFKDILASDIICIHANLHNNSPYPSLNLFNFDIFTKLNKGVVIINAARGGIVNEDDLLSARKDIVYCTDVYVNEPNVNAKIVDFATLCTPHIAGHSIEAKQRAVDVVFSKLAQFATVEFPKRTIVNLNDCFISQNNSGGLLQNTVLQDSILNLYNPLHETLAFKKAINKSDIFLILRKSHNYRHDFML